jgi:hypothetical protein
VQHAGVFVVEELLNVDGRILTTMKLLFTRPWQLGRSTSSRDGARATSTRCASF